MRSVLRITKLADYATLILLIMAEDADALISSVVVRQRAQLEPATVSKILKTLTNAGLVTSLRGPRGGYRLARSAETITLLDILQAIDGPFALTECMLPEPVTCQRTACCPARPHWQRVQTQLHLYLHSVPLSSLLHPPLAATLPPSSTCAPLCCCQNTITF